MSQKFLATTTTRTTTTTTLLQQQQQQLLLLLLTTTTYNYLQLPTTETSLLPQLLQQHPAPTTTTTKKKQLHDDNLMRSSSWPRKGSTNYWAKDVGADAFIKLGLSTDDGDDGLGGCASATHRGCCFVALARTIHQECVQNRAPVFRE